MAFTARLGTPDSKLGNIVLGFGAPATNEPADNFLTITQVASCQKIVSADVTNTITYTQTPIVFRPIGSSSTLTLSQAIVLQNTKPTSNTLSYSQSATFNRVSNVSILATFIPINTTSRNSVSNLSPSNTLTYSQTNVNILSRNAVNTLTYTQTATCVLSKKAVNFFDYGQLLETVFLLKKTTNSLFQYFQTFSHTKTLNISVTSTYAPVSEVNQTIAKGGNSTLTLTQTVTFNVSHATRNQLTFGQSVGLQKTNNLTVLHKLRLFQDTIDAATTRKSASNALGFNQVVKAWKVFTLSVTSSLNLTQEEVRERFLEDIDQSLTLSQSVVKTKIITENVRQTLSLTQSMINNSVIHQSTTNTLTYLPNHLIYMPVNNINYVPVDNLLATKIPGPGIDNIPYYNGTFFSIGQTPRRIYPYCVLQVPEKAITLPAPEFNDVENYGGIFTIKRSMTGKTVTYVHKLTTGKLRYEFVIGAQKRLELESYILSFNSRIHRLTNWKGELWNVFITTNPFEIVSKSRYSNGKNDSNDDIEKVTIAIEFEGTRIH